MKSPFDKPFKGRSPFGPGGSVVAAPVLTLVYDGLAEDPPTFLFDVDVTCDGYYELHSTATPPGVGNGDVGSGSLGTLVAGENDIGTIDLSAYSGETFYLHIYAVNSGGNDVITSQEITMPLIDVQQQFYPMIGGAAGTINPATLATLQTNSSYSVAYCDQASEAMGINYVGIRFGSVTSCNITVTIEGVNASDGLPDGTPIASSASTAVTADSYNLIALTSQADIARGAMYAVKFAYTSGTSAVIQRIAWSIFGGSSGVGRPYQVIATGGAGAKAVLTQTPSLALGSTATSFYKLPWAFSGAETITANNFNSGSSPAVRGMRVSLPFSARLTGIRLAPQNTTGDFNIVVYDASNTELSSSSTAIDASQTSTSTNDTNNFYFDNPVTLVKNTVYYVSIEPSSVTNVSLPTITLNSTNYAAATPWGTGLYYATRTGSTWSSTPGQLPMMSLILDQR